LTETSKASKKSPISPKFTKIVQKSLSEVIKKPEQSDSQSIQEQPYKKTIDILGITELPSNLVCNEQGTKIVEHKLENMVQNVLNEIIVPTTTIQVSDQYLPNSKELETHKTVASIDNSSNIIDDCINEDISSNVMNVQNVNQLSGIQEHNLETIEEDLIKPLSSIDLANEQEDEDICSSLGFIVVKKDECVPQLNCVSQTVNNSGITINDNHFNLTNENIVESKQNKSNKTQSCAIDIEDNFEPMNDKLVLGDVPFETDSSQSDASDNERERETDKTENFETVQTNSVDDIFSFTDLSIKDFSRVDSTEDFIDQFIPKSIRQSEGETSISTDDGSIHSRKSYSEAVVGSLKDGECYFNYDFEIVDDCLDCDNEDKSVVVEVTEKEFPELKPKYVSDNRRRNKKQKKRNNSSNKKEYQSGKYK